MISMIIKVRLVTSYKSPDVAQLLHLSLAKDAVKAY